MTGFTVELWLIVQLLIETGLCVLIIYYIYGATNLRRETMLEKEKMKTVIDSLQHLIKKYEALDKKRQKVLELCRRIEGKGAVLETGIDRYKEECDEMGSSAHAYEKMSRLIEKGLSANEISQKLGLPQGEVELAMNLKRQ
jgi:predicted nuclease with TOPRIM domain